MVSYEEGIKVTYRGFWILAVVTLAEVGIALFGNGHVIHGLHVHKAIMYPLMVGLSAYKAYYIVKYFMHMGYEVKGLAMSVLLPCLLLVWAIIAFFQEGSSWGSRREQINKKNEQVVKPASQPTGMLDIQSNTNKTN